MTLEEQFPYKQVSQRGSLNYERSIVSNNQRVINILRYIIENSCKLEHRSNLDKEDWKPGTMREFLHYLTSCSPDKKEVQGLDTWTLNFWRIKTKADSEETWKLTHIANDKED